MATASGASSPRSSVLWSAWSNLAFALNASPMTKAGQPKALARHQGEADVVDRLHPAQRVVEAHAQTFNAEDGPLRAHGYLMGLWRLLRD